jgi:hypothetical protein
MKNRQITLKSHPDGVPTVDNFGLTESEVPQPGPGHFVVPWKPPFAAGWTARPITSSRYPSTA